MACFAPTRTGSASKSSLSFEEYLKDNFMANEFLFYRHLLAFAKTQYSSKQEMAAAANHIFHTFIIENAVYQVGIPKLYLKKIEAGIKSPSHSLFQDVMLEIGAQLNHRLEEFKRVCHHSDDEDEYSKKKMSIRSNRRKLTRVSSEAGDISPRFRSPAKRMTRTNSVVRVDVSDYEYDESSQEMRRRSFVL